jgi:hypothetical protein
MLVEQALLFGVDAEIIAAASEGEGEGEGEGERAAPTAVCRITGGTEADVLKAKMSVMKKLGEMRDAASAAAKPKTSWPSTWAPMPPGKDCVLVQLSPDSAEFKGVDVCVKRTLPESTTLKIERVQSAPMWEQFALRRERIAKKNGGDPNELQLFHGTLGTDPALIYDGEMGFDNRYSSLGCLWGPAAYFAVNASYSHRYAHTTDGARQFFLARVTVGKDVELSMNPSLRCPPPMPGSAVLYDTVRGITGGSTVYMVYETLSRAYPEYLITYKSP